MGRREPDDGADDETETDDLDELEQARRDADAAAADRSIDDGEEDDGRPVVDEALPLDEQREPRGGSEGLEERDDGDGIGRRDERREDERVRPAEAALDLREARARHQQGRRDADGHENAGHGEREDGPSVVA